MAGILSSSPTSTITPAHLISKRAQRSRIRCSSPSIEPPHNERINNSSAGGKSRAPETKTPSILKFAVSGVTEVLRLFSSSSKDRLQKGDVTVTGESDEAISALSVDGVVRILRIDYENAYFVTGSFTSGLYVEDCLFEDPTIRFRGTDLYSRNLKLLVPFFEHPSIELQSIEKDVNCSTNLVLATWKLRTYLRFPWRPLISIDGVTVYELNEDLQIVRHTESWNVSALEALGQIFTPSFVTRPSD
ncbi:hypothetical protein LINGRAHAP2_LOCUS32073 [Linum grandiflorum]